MKNCSLTDVSYQNMLMVGKLSNMFQAWAIGHLFWYEGWQNRWSYESLDLFKYSPVDSHVSEMGSFLEHYSDYPFAYFRKNWPQRHKKCPNCWDHTWSWRPNITGFQLFRPWADFRPSRVDLDGNWDQCKSNEKSICRGGISETNWATEMVHLSKFAEFHEDLNGHTFNIATQLQIMIKCQKMIFKCTFRQVQYVNRALRHVAAKLFSPYNL